MNDITPETFSKQPFNILDGLPDWLKKPESYEKVQRAVLDAMASGCSHSDPAAWMDCKKCGAKMVERRLLLKRFGFKSPAQYLQWKKVHEVIKKRYPLAKYNS